MKGQTVTLDFVTAVFLFLGLVAMAMVMWNSFNDEIATSSTINEMKRTGNTALSYMISSKGDPLDWNSTSVESLGLSSGREGIIDPEKFEEMLSIDYENGKEALSVPYEYLIEFRNTNGDLVTVAGNDTSFGMEPNTTSTVVVSRRVVIMDDVVGLLSIEVWR